MYFLITHLSKFLIEKLIVFFHFKKQKKYSHHVIYLINTFNIIVFFNIFYEKKKFRTK